MTTTRTGTPRVATTDTPVVSPYRTAGEFMVDYARVITAKGEPDTRALKRIAAARLYETRVVQDQYLSDTPGLVPQPIVEPIVSLIADNRPLITSLGGARPLAGVDGATFTRPKVTAHATVGAQSAGEKKELASQAMTIGSVTFTKSTFGGSLNISRQEMDWTSPPAWDAVLRDLADAYALGTEQAVATAFAAAPTSTVAMTGTGLLGDWTKALYTAGMHSYQACSRMPDRTWVSLDVWAALGGLVDAGRPVIPDPGTESLAGFRGDLLGAGRIVVPTFPNGTAIVGNHTLFEVYEETIGLLSVVEPFILGVMLGYGGYVAFGAVAPAGLVKLTGLPALPS
jgi:hypothetical protein